MDRQKRHAAAGSVFGVVLIFGDAAVIQKAEIQVEKGLRIYIYAPFSLIKSRVQNADTVEVLELVDHLREHGNVTRWPEIHKANIHLRGENI